MSRHVGTALALITMIVAGVAVMWPSPGRQVARADAAPPEEAQPTDAEDVTNPLGPNVACYVCHMTFVREPIAKLHLAAEVFCVECHGQSSGHANDEDIGATKPDRMYGREEINDACRACHENHDATPEAVVGRWVELGLTEVPPVCTDCHGEHRIG